MANMRDAFKKARILSDKDAKRLAHEERIARSKTSGKQRDAAEQARQAELQERQDQQREEDRLRQQQLDAERKVAEERRACQQIVTQQVRRLGGGTSRPMHVLLADGRIPALPLSPEDQAGLRSKDLVLVRIGPSGSLEFGLLPAAHATRIGKVLPDLLV